MPRWLNLHEYEESIRIASFDYPFYALIAAAMRKADTNNLGRLRRMFPYVYDGLVRRLNEPLGVVEEWDGITPERYAETKK